MSVGLASLDKAFDISQQPANSELSKSEFWQVIQSLARRSLVEKVQIGTRAMFQINPIFKQYIESQPNPLREKQ